jgi:hypothetical protein
MARFYLYLQDGYVEKIMFKNNLQKIKSIVKAHAEGEVNTISELEQIMVDEA